VATGYPGNPGADLDRLAVVPGREAAGGDQHRLVMTCVPSFRSMTSPPAIREVTTPSLP
jgi:hypothetical protein